MLAGDRIGGPFFKKNYFDFLMALFNLSFKRKGSTSIFRLNYHFDLMFPEGLK